MATTSPRHLRSVEEIGDDRHIVIETPEHEVIDLEGCSADEVQAKLHDFEAWAS